MSHCASTLSALSDRSRIAIEGCDIEIGSKAVLALSLVLHELATNAAKYGALSSEADASAFIATSKATRWC